ncbi:MAG: lysoplasmalogenase [Rubrivivax sp.]|jgi:uncharacterized membrane protein YhhN
MNRHELGCTVVAFKAGLLAVLSAPWALDAPWLNFLCKPLATAALIALAWPRGRDWPWQRACVLAGLALSWCGDVALLWPQQGFLPGLVSFLLAHLAYLLAFTRASATPQGPVGARLAAVLWPFLAFAAVAGTVLHHLWPGVPAALRGPVVVYVLALASMAAQAAVLWRLGQPRAGVLALGGALFVASDALLATNKFAGPLPFSSFWILATYWPAQWCIARWLPPPAR